jgi:hypothetical protein
MHYYPARDVISTSRHKCKYHMCPNKLSVHLKKQRRKGGGGEEAREVVG